MVFWTLFPQAAAVNEDRNHDDRQQQHHRSDGDGHDEPQQQERQDQPQHSDLIFLWAPRHYRQQLWMMVIIMTD